MVSLIIINPLAYFNSNSISELNIDKLCLFDLPRTGLLEKILDLVKDITAAQCWNSPPIVTFNNEPGTALTFVN